MPNCFIRSVIQGAACVLLAGLGPVQAETVTVFAAASLKAALDDVAVEFENVSDHKVLLSFASSSALARQIERGAPADVFISANTDWMDRLATEGLLEPDSRVALLTNQLVLIAPKDADRPKTSIDDIDFTTLLEAGPMAMGFVDAVPAGIYGKSALVSLGLWDSLSTHIAQTDNVRSALALVARGEAPLGIVYATDAISEARVSVVALFPQASHAPIVYPAAVIAPATAAASEFAAYLAAPEARATFEGHGFGNVAP